MKLTKKSSFILWLAVDAVLLIAIIVLAILLVKAKSENNAANNELSPTPTMAVSNADVNEGDTKEENQEKPDPTPTPTIAPTPTTTVIGWNERETGRQYVDADNNLLMSTKKTIDGQTYFFDEKGFVRTGWYNNEKDGATYYLGEDGAMVAGITTVVDGVEQVFDEEGKWLGTAAEVAAKAPTATPTPTPQQLPTETPVIEDDKYSQYSTKAEGWWFERKADHSQSTAWGYDTKYKFEQNNTFYVDKTVSDDDKVIYLTFDCGYENGYTDEILDTLKKHNAQAVFFVTKSYIRDAKDLVVRMKEEGHLVGNHTVTHPNLANCSTEKVVKELTECADYMKEKTGYSMDPFMRPPEGAYSEKSLQITQDLGYKTILWSIAYLDWDTANQPGKDYVVDHFTKYHHNGAIPLIHVVSESNMQALDDVLTMLENEGYRFASVTELP